MQPALLPPSWQQKRLLRSCLRKTHPQCLIPAWTDTCNALSRKQTSPHSKRCAQIRKLEFWNAESYGYCVSSPWQPKSKDACGKLPCIRRLLAISFSSCFLIGTHLRVGLFSCNFSFLWKRNSKIFEILWKITRVYLWNGQISENKKKMSFYKELFYGYLLTLLNLIIYNWEGR